MVSSTARRLLARIALVLACGLMVALPLSHYLCVRYALHVGYIAGTLYGFGLLAAAVVAAAFLLRAVPRRFSSYDWLFLGLSAWGLVSVLFSADRHTSFWGSASRCEGLLMLLCYYLFFYLGRLVCEPGLQNKLLLFFLGVMLLHCLYGLSQQYHFWGGTFDYYYYAISGVAGNPNFMATLTVMAVCVALGLLLFSRSLPLRIACAVVLPVYLATMALTKAVSAVLGMAVVAVFLVVRVWKNGSARLRIAVVVCLIAAAGAALYLDGMSNQFLARELRLFADQLGQLFRTGALDPEFAAGRPYLWYNSLLLFLRHPLTGVGIDNLLTPYYNSFGLFLGQFVDKTHNEFLQILVTMGLPALLGYLLFYGFIFRDLGKRIQTVQTGEAAPLALLLCLIGYLAQAFFNISVIDAAPYFWLLCGLMAPMPDREFSRSRKGKPSCAKGKKVV